MGSLKKVFLKKFHKIHRKTPVLESPVLNFIKKRLQQRCFPVHFMKFLRMYSQYEMMAKL